MTDDDLETLEVTPPPPAGAPAADGWPAATARPRWAGPGAAIAVLVATMLVAGLAGFAVTSGFRSTAPFRDAISPSTIAPRPAPTTVPTEPPATPSDDPDMGVLEGLGVTPADVGTSAQVFLIRDGDRVGSALTLDLCEGTFASEGLRTARYQVVAVDEVGDRFLSTEAVLYRRPADTAQAFREVRAVARRCPESTARLGADPDRTWSRTPGVERLAYDVTATDVTGEEFRSLVVYLRRGRVLLGVYLPEPGARRPAVAGESSAEGIVGVFERRLAALPATVVAGAHAGV